MVIYKNSDYKHQVKLCFEQHQHMHYCLLSEAQDPSCAVGQEPSDDHNVYLKEGCGFVPSEAPFGHMVLHS